MVTRQSLDEGRESRPCLRTGHCIHGAQSVNRAVPGTGLVIDLAQTAKKYRHPYAKGAKDPRRTRKRNEKPRLAAGPERRQQRRYIIPRVLGSQVDIAGQYVTNPRKISIVSSHGHTAIVSSVIPIFAMPDAT